MARMNPGVNRRLSLEWGVKRSLVEYVLGMPDGSATLGPPARAFGDSFRFAAVEGQGAEGAEEAGEGFAEQDTLSESGQPTMGSRPSEASQPNNETNQLNKANPPLNRHTLRFAGSLTLSGHGGLLRLVIEDPWLMPSAESDSSETWLLTIADPYEPGSRITFATMAGLDFDRSREPGICAIGTGTLLSSDGADLFFSGPYREGTELDDPKIIAHE